MVSMPMRRRLFRAGMTAVVAGAATGGAIAMPRRAPGVDEIARLAFVNTHTGEKLDVVYRERGQYLTDAIAEIDRVLRDHRSGEVFPIDRALLDQLDQLGALLGTGTRPFHVISGYRSPATNARLAARSGGVATRSLHMSGRAIDIRMPGVPLAGVHRAALSMQVGGVGYYPRSDFVHVDTGRVRAW
ncbi:MAG: YcbK family protein [Burkholderiaceae bacterium]|nr:YcbK family protein [Burkholderiaceae bacterium]